MTTISLWENPLRTWLLRCSLLCILYLFVRYSPGLCRMGLVFFIVVNAPLCFLVSFFSSSRIPDRLFFFYCIPSSSSQARDLFDWFSSGGLRLVFCSCLVHALFRVPWLCYVNDCLPCLASSFPSVALCCVFFFREPVNAGSCKYRALARFIFALMEGGKFFQF